VPRKSRVLTGEGLLGLKRFRRAPLLVRRFGLVQAGELLLPEVLRTTRFAGLGVERLGGDVARFRLRDSTVLWFRPFSMDLGIFHEIWDHERYTEGSVGEQARGGTVVDIGAHVGLFSVYASRVIGAKRIVSVEPDSTNFQLLSRNVSANAIENATLVNAAVAGESGEKRIYIDPSNTGGHGFYSRGVHSKLVKTFSLSELFEASRVAECSLLKMDCEGAEMEVFEGAEDELLTRVSAIVLEYHLDEYPVERLEMFQKRIETIGFDIEVQPTGRAFGILRGTRRN
jgi:FkbM family methyltransferase